MSTFTNCAVKHNVDTKELMEDAKVYAKRGLDMGDALIKAAKDKIGLLMADEAEIIASIKKAQQAFSPKTAEPLLKTYDEADLKKADDAKKATEQAKVKTEEKAKIDDQANDFELTGSDRKADSNPAQADLLADKAPKTAENQKSEPLGKVGSTPKNAQEITIKDGDIWIGDEPAISYETGENVKAKGATLDDIKAALKEAGTVTSKDKFYRIKDDGIAGGEIKLYDVTGVIGEGLTKVIKHLYANSDNPAAKNARQAFKDLKIAVGESKLTAKERVAKVSRFAFIGEASAMRLVANARNSEAVKKVWQHLSDLGGVEGVKGQVFEDAFIERFHRNQNIVGNALAELDDSAIQQVKRLIENRKNINTNTSIGKAAKAISDALDVEIADMKAAGMDIGKSDNFFPRTYLLTKIAGSQDKFVRIATKAYMLDGLSASEAKKAAENWHTAELLKAGGAIELPFSGSGSSTRPNADFAKSRVISKKAFDESGLSEFTDPDVKHILASYFRKSAKRVEFEKRFGGTEFNKDGTIKTTTARYDAIMKELRAEGNGDLEHYLHDAIISATGQNKQATGGSKAVVDVLRSLSIVQYLRRAVISSLTEPVQAYNRTAPLQGQVKGLTNMAKVYGNAIGDFVNNMGMRELTDDLGFKKLNLDRDEKFRFAEMIGATINKYVEGSMAAIRYDDALIDIDATSKGVSSAMNALSNAAVKASYLHDYTNSNIVDAIDIGRDLIREMASQVGGNGNKNKLAQYELERLGLTVEQGKSLDKYIKKNNDIDKIIADKNAGNQDAANYVNAINRFQKQVIAQATAADRPSLAKHAYARVAFNFQGWLTKYWYNVQRVGIKQIAMAIKNERGFSASERASLAATPVIASIITYQMVEHLTLALRDLYSGKDSDDEFKEQQEATVAGIPIKEIRKISQSGALGLADPWVNKVTSARYNQDPIGSFGGAILNAQSKVLREGVNTISDKNSDNNNNQERALAKAGYYAFIDPAVAALTAVAPFSKAATAVGQRDELQRMFVDTVAGQSTSNAEKKVEKSGKLYEETGDEKYFDLANIDDSRKAIQTARRNLNADIKELQGLDDMTAAEKKRIEKELRDDYNTQEKEFLAEFNKNNKGEFWNK